MFDKIIPLYAEENYMCYFNIFSLCKVTKE